MPRKPPTNVIEHRISLSDFERSRLKEYMQTQRTEAGFTSAGAILQGVSWPLLAVAALWWVSFSLDDFIDAVTGFVDNTSTKIVTKFEKEGWVNYEADEYGREVVKIQNEMEALRQEIEIIHARMRAQGPPWAPADEARANQIHTRMAVLSKREKVLISLIHKISEGEIKGYRTGGERQFRESLSEAYEEEWLEMYGEKIDVQDTIWDIELGEDQSITDEDIQGYTS